MHQEALSCFFARCEPQLKFYECAVPSDVDATELVEIP